MNNIKNALPFRYHKNICEQCGKEFLSKGKIKVILCPDCKKAYNYKTQRQSYIFHKKKENPDYIPKEEKVQFADKKKKKRKKPKSISQCIAIIEKYNREHGQHYTYGKFPYPEMLR